jgi:TolA-binding protein
MQLSLKISPLIFVLLFIVSCSTQVPVQKMPVHKSSGNPHLWLPPSQIELEARRARQSRLDEIAEQIGNLYLSHDEMYRSVENLGTFTGEMANRIDAMEPDLELAMVQEGNNREALKLEVVTLAKTSTRIHDQIKAIHHVKRKPAKKKRANHSMKYYFNAIKNFRDADYAESIKMFKASLKNKPPARLIDNIYFGIGVSRYQLGQFESATASFNRVVEQYSKADKWLISQVMLGLAYFKNGESSRALYILTRARRNTESPTLHRMIDRIMDDLEKETLYAAIK